MMFEDLRYRVTAEINRKSNEMVLGVVRDILTENGYETVYEINEKAVIKAFEALKKQNSCKDCAWCFQWRCDVANIIQDFAEAVKLEFYKEFEEIIPSVMSDRIDALVRERTGE